MHGNVFISSICDAYQPVEKKIGLTKRVLENMDKKTRLSVLTKSDTVTRDVELFKQFEFAEIGLSLSRLKKKFEPRAPKHSKRVDALKKMKENRLKTYGFISPVVPGLVDVEGLIKETKGFVDYYMIEFLNLKAAGKEFREQLESVCAEGARLLEDKDWLLKEARRLKGLDQKIKKIVLHPWKLF